MARRLSALVLTCVAGMAAAQPIAALAQQAAPPGLPPEVMIGFVALTDDPRYDRRLAHLEILVRKWGPALDGADLGITDAIQIGREINVAFAMEGALEADVATMIADVEEWVGDGIHFVIADLPADLLLELADGVAAMPVTIFNVSAPEDSLRGAECRQNVIHMIPSNRMLTDATLQYLVSRRWRNILVLQGPSAEDAALVEALRESAANFQGRIVDVRPFVPGNDPRNRDLSNVAVLTAAGNYDVVFVADADGEFAAQVPYNTNDPRPVVGAAGLVPVAWHWAWDRQGAPQLNARFEYFYGRRMGADDWAAWTAVRAVTQAVIRTASTEYETLLDYILGDQLSLDGVKAASMSVRPWDHQLRQPILLATGNAVVQRAPVEGFVHPTNNLDTLGVDAGQTACRF
ncbi:MAG: ABC transporter substrate-binding protein [Bauldia sp.]|nr:ABC transporter substrate-binding protein [Bauldia sp.]MCW5718199.1 ABC transporter substrate-binding protein [Bauldia sp.]